MSTSFDTSKLVDIIVTPRFSSNESAPIGAGWLAGLFQTIASWLTVSAQGSASIAAASTKSIAEEMAEQYVNSF